LRANIAYAAVVDVSKVSEAQLGWKWWEEDVVQQYGVVLNGWTVSDKITDPSNLSTSQTVICTLLEAVRTGECAFRKLGPVEAAKRKAKWEEDVVTGRVVVKHCILTAMPAFPISTRRLRRRRRRRRMMRTNSPLQSRAPTTRTHPYLPRSVPRSVPVRRKTLPLRLGSAL
jgi:hypothetical protein